MIGNENNTKRKKTTHLSFFIGILRFSVFILTTLIKSSMSCLIEPFALQAFLPFLLPVFFRSYPLSAVNISLCKPILSVVTNVLLERKKANVKMVIIVQTLQDEIRGLC
jgi:hypothetical protein